MPDDSPAGVRPAPERRVMSAAKAGKVRFARDQRAVATRPETVLWTALRRNALGFKFRRQHPIEDFVLDFYCEECRLAIEVDGPTHEERSDYDSWRDARMRQRGIHTLRVLPVEVQGDLTAVLATIREACLLHRNSQA